MGSPFFGPIAGFAVLVLPSPIALLVFSTILTRAGAKRTSVHALFSVTFALSVDLLIMLTYEIGGVLEPSVRQLAWRAILLSLVVLLAVVLPAFAFYLLARDAGAHACAAQLAAAAGSAAWLWAFWRAGNFFPLQLKGDHDLFSLEGAVGRLGVAGVTTAAVLSGYGAVANPYAYLNFAPARAATDSDVRAAKRALKEAADRAKEAEHKLVRAERRLADSYSSSSGGGTATPRGAAAVPSITPGGGGLASLISSLPLSLPGFIGGGARAGATAGAHAALVAEIAARRAEVAISNELFSEAEEEFRELTVAKERSREADSCWGRSSASLGIVLSLYCVYRIASSLFNIATQRDPTKDPITAGLELLLLYFNVPPARAAWFVQPASFILVGVLAVSSVRGFLASLVRLVSFSSGGARLWGANADALGGGDADSAATAQLLPVRDALHSAASLLVAELLGTYILSTILLLRMSVPEEYRAGITRAVGDIHFNFFHRWFDVIFVLAACVAIVGHVLTAVNRTSRLGSALAMSASAGGAVDFRGGLVDSVGANGGSAGGGGGRDGNTSGGNNSRAHSRASSLEEERVEVNVHKGVRAPAQKHLHLRERDRGAAVAPASPRADARTAAPRADGHGGARGPPFQRASVDSPRKSPGRFV